MAEERKHLAQECVVELQRRDSSRAFPALSRTKGPISSRSQQWLSLARDSEFAG